MGDLNYQFDGLSSREGFNRSLRHFKMMMELVEDFEANYNLADIIQNCIQEKRIEEPQIKPILNALLADKYKYYTSSHNMKDNLDKFEAMIGEIGKWKAVDVVLTYFHPELGTYPINPKNPKHWEAVQSLKRNELVTVYIGTFKNTEYNKLYDDALKTIKSLLDGQKVKGPVALTRGKYVLKVKRVREAPPPQLEKKSKTAKMPKVNVSQFAPTSPKSTSMQQYQQQSAAQQQVAISSTPTRMTPQYGITVTNELFHNGNVEAWKKIIESYEHSHTSLQVYVFYDGERINDINTLFKWGKVKRGTSIMISIAGENAIDVAKLKRYLMQGASHMFEAFLKGPPNQILRLF